ncbi:MAG: PAS domain S-box protein [Nitrospinae bacterium]|nr:PAS domain S-box protein [Nitrospinota bacterium]
MKSTSKTKAQLLEELSGLRSRVAELEKRHDKGNGKKVIPAVARVDRTGMVNKKKSTGGHGRGNTYRPSGKTRVEEAIQETEAQFRVALEDGTVPMATLTPDLQLVKVNRAFCDLLGYAKQELKGRIIKDIIHPDDVEQSVDLTTERLYGGVA